MSSVIKKGKYFPNYELEKFDKIIRSTNTTDEIEEEKHKLDMYRLSYMNSETITAQEKQRLDMQENKVQDMIVKHMRGD